jgi:hypothetical protein
MNQTTVWLQASVGGKAVRFDASNNATMAHVKAKLTSSITLQGQVFSLNKTQQNYNNKR